MSKETDKEPPLEEEIQYWAGRLIGHDQAYEIAEEIVNAIKAKAGSLPSVSDEEIDELAEKLMQSENKNASIWLLKDLVSKSQRNDPTDGEIHKYKMDAVSLDHWEGFDLAIERMRTRLSGETKEQEDQEELWKEARQLIENLNIKDLLSQYTISRK